MIRIQRPAEPDQLRTDRRQRLAHAFLSAQDRKTINVDEGYHSAREPIYGAQNKKCAYCERQQGQASGEVEHFRPKGGVDAGDPLCYFWLTWTWENLLFACSACHHRPNKGNRFPLASGTAPLPHPTISEILSGQGPAFEVGSEQPLLIDPSREDPMDHIVWRPENGGDPPEAQRWRPMDISSLRGRKTIEVMGLLSDLPDHVGSHIRTHINPGVQRIRCAMAANQRELVQSEWARLVQSLFVPLQPYHAASHDALNYWIPSDDRKAWGLTLPRPGRHEANPPSHDVADHPKLAQMSDSARLEARARRINADELILLLCRETAWSETELADATGYAPGTIQQWRRTLIRSKKLTGGAEGYIVPPVDAQAIPSPPNMSDPGE